MPWYLLKGLTITFLVLLVLAGVGVGAGAFISDRLTDNVDAARTRGYEEGYARGYGDGIKKGNEVGYQEGSKLGYVEAGGPNANEVSQKGYYFLYNPSYDEVMSTLNSNEIYSAYNILDYAKANGMRAAYVRVPIAREASEGRVYLYQLVAFETVDRGLVIIEPHSHREVKVEVGKSYSQLNNFPVSPYDDTITKVTIVW